MSENLIQIRGVRGGTVYYDKEGKNVFRSVSLRNAKGRRYRKMVCCTGQFLHSLEKWTGEKKEINPCLCEPGFAHNHPPVSLDDIRHLYTRHGIRLRCMLYGSGTGREVFAKIVCQRYFKDNWAEHIEKVKETLESSTSSLREGYMRGVLMARGDGVYGDGRVTTENDSRLQVSIVLLLYSAKECFLIPLFLIPSGAFR